MKKSFFPKRLKDISIAKKLYFIVGAMAILIVVELVTLWFAIHTLSSLRAFVGAEGLWSKAQKDAVYHLRKYNQTHNEADWKDFQKFMEVPLGDHATRLELLKPQPNMNKARQGFIQGRVHPDDIDGMIKLFRRFHQNYYIDKAINVWTKADLILFDQLLPVADKLHAAIGTGKADATEIIQLTREIDQINQGLTALEDDFSYTLGKGSRWLENLILKILLIVALTVEVTGLVLTIAVTRSISKELKAINKATSKIAKGDLSARANVFSTNEIGLVAADVNRMAEQLILSNKELEQVAYIASHDLQEPLRTISNFVGLFQRRYKDKLDVHTEEYLHFINNATTRMQSLVKDLLDYSTLGNNKCMETINCNKLLQDVLQDMDASIHENKAEISSDPLPVIEGYGEIKSLFQNLISNAIKFRKKETSPVIHIGAQARGEDWMFSIKDNGIGMEDLYHERIFTIFQKLHPNSHYVGTGIGLAHCKKIVELHRGKIWVQSAPDEGSIFYFTLPKQPA
jgi:two-component system, sensor histidine kinase